MYSVLVSFIVLVEGSGRWPELAMYMFPKFLESIPIALTKVKRDDLINFKHGHSILFGIALAITSHIYYKDPVSVKKSMTFILDLIIGQDDNMDSKVLGKTPVKPIITLTPSTEGSE